MHVNHGFARTTNCTFFYWLPSYTMKYVTLHKNKHTTLNKHLKNNRSDKQSPMFSYNQKQTSITLPWIIYLVVTQMYRSHWPDGKHGEINIINAPYEMTPQKYYFVGNNLHFYWKPKSNLYCNERSNTPSTKTDKSTLPK